MAKKIRILFESASDAERNNQPNEFVQIVNINQIDKNFAVLPAKTGNMDAGSIIALVLGAPSIVILAKGIADSSPKGIGLLVASLKMLLLLFTFGSIFHKVQCVRILH